MNHLYTTFVLSLTLIISNIPNPNENVDLSMPEPLYANSAIKDKKEYSDDVKLIALCALGEAEDEPEKGQRLVIDTILNRVDDDDWPDTVSDVIYQSGQFVCMTNGRIDRVTVTDEMCDLVIEEMEERTNTKVVFFNAVGYTKYGEALFKVGSHYFSKEKTDEHQD